MMMGDARVATHGSRRFTTSLVGLLAIAVFPAAAQAQFGAEVRMQMGFGGDNVATIEYSDGSESDLRLGKYFTISAGPVLEAWSSEASSIELQAMAGWSGWSTGPGNTEDRLRLNRFPLELLAFYGRRVPARDMLLRIGGGVTYHLGGGVSGSGSLDGTEIDLDNALGFTGEVSAIFGILSAGLRYTQMDVAISGAPTALDGSSLGLFVGLTTPR